MPSFSEHRNSVLLRCAALRYAERGFEPKAYHFTDPCESAVTCCCTCGLAGPVTSRAVELEADELVVHVSNWCYTRTARAPYSQMDGVDVDESCGVCYDLDGVGGACAGCGDAAPVVNHNFVRQATL